MNTYDDLVNDYLRAVEQASAGIPASRREELLADLSQHIAAKRAELSPETEVEVRSILELLGDPSDVAAEAMLDNDPALPAPPIQIQPGKKLGALAWVLLTVAAVSTLCVAAVLVGVFFFAWSGSSSGDVPAAPGSPQIQEPTMQPPSSPSTQSPPTPSTT
ncbi:hypothetical protein ABZS66_13935 [Dactylosporangium sp. NPDC005572]|uniref:HAAS signaling domain-containing protein n=1 Tax=Dactylosporangium sp. NPDC005572 TaxID=3156889 RepID=UPI0033A17F8D